MIVLSLHVPFEMSYKPSSILGYFKRNHKKEELSNIFTKEQKSIIAESIQKLNKVLLKSQKETLPLDLYEYYDEL